VNLSKGRTGDLNSKLLGMIFVMKFQAAAMSRANIPEEERVDFSLYVDEFQNFSTDSFATIMSEARKYHLNLIVANQFTTQLTPEIRDAVFGNMGTIVSFRIGQNDVEAITKYFQPTFDADDLLRIPNHNSIIRTLIGGVPTQPFSMAMLPPLGSPNPKLAGALKQLSAAKFGRPRAEVEKEIFERLATKPEAKPAFGAPAGGFGTGPANRPAAPGPVGTGNFLDEWMAKRPAGQTTAPALVSSAPMPTAAPASTPAPAQPAFTATPATPIQSTPVKSQPADSSTFALANPIITMPQISPAKASSATAEPEVASTESGETPAGQGSMPSSADEIMRQHSSASAQETANQKTEVHNISSAESSDDEVAKIANELRQNLGMEGVEVNKPRGEKVIKPPKQEKKSDITKLAESAETAEDGTVELPALRPQTAPEAENPADTIDIDNEGNIVSKDDSKAS
jgi:hypothetical protein